MKKRTAFLHVGLHDGSADFVEDALVEHRHALEALGVICPAESTDEAFRAALDITREHRAWGYRRGEVEGAWSVLCRRALRAPKGSTVLISQPLLAAADRDQIDLLLTQLPTFDLHVVLSVGDGQGLLAEATQRWARPLAGHDRMHVVSATAKSRDDIWREMGRIVGFGTASLPLPAPGPPVDLDRELRRLTRRNDYLEQLAAARVSAAARRPRRLFAR